MVAVGTGLEEAVRAEVETVARVEANMEVVVKRTTQ